jgi:2-oxoglutarate ferredoxin oxidoreductase subunit alpha
LLGIEPTEMSAAAKERYHKIEDKSLVDRTVAHGASLIPQDLNAYRMAPAKASPRMILTGNQAVSLGAIRAGCNFVAGYPITPASPMLEYLAQVLPGMAGTVLQTEDEMAAIGACLGASYVGSKAMTTTSGPGFALMSEMINLGVMAELPLVIVDVQRSGPSTGMPSKTEQGDLLYAMYGSPGESPRVVLAASDVRDGYNQTVRAFNLAETLQCPVILLSDQSLAYRNETVDLDFGQDDMKIVSRIRKNGELPAEYRRFLITDSGASPASLPGGTDVPFMTTGLEHDEFGRENYSPENHHRMTAKRNRKLDTAARLAAEEERDFDKPIGARVGVLGWGSTRGTILETCHGLADSGEKVARLHLHTLRPLPESLLRDFTTNLDRLIVVEENFSAQLAMLIRGVVDCEVVSVNKCEGLPFDSQELLNEIGAVI